jgi:hypothetical protein
MRYLLFVCTIICLTACNNEPKWRLKCYARYVEDDSYFETKVEFRAMKQAEVAALEMEDVRFNDGAMQHNNNNVVGHYYRARSTSYPSTFFEYVFTKEKKKNMLQFVPPPAISGMVIKDNSVSKSNGFTLLWTGNSLTKEENLTVTLTDELGITAQVTVNGALPKAEAKIPATMYSGLKPGKVSISVVKTAIPKVIFNNIEADVEVGYYCKTIESTIIE